MNPLYNKIALGGTFDQLHKGHKGLIDFAFSKSKNVVIGILSDQFAKSMKLISNFSQRRSAILNYLKEKNYLERSKIVKLENIFGPTLIDLSIEAIAVTSSSIKGALLINKRREKLNIKPLEVLVFDLIKTKEGSVISSSLIRQGKINAEGIYLWSYFASKTYYLPKSLREEISKPQGRMYKNINNFAKKYKHSGIITVGDETTRRLIRLGVKTDLSIVDFKVNRKFLFKNLTDLGIFNVKSIQVDNVPGTICNGLSCAIFNYFDKNLKSFVIKVNGEEDLAVIPCVLLAPIGTLIAYGQPREGLVLLTVDLNLKDKFLSLLKKFKTLPLPV